MNPTFDAAWSSWPIEPALTAALLVTAVVYLRGWFSLRRRSDRHWHAWQAIAFIGGLAGIFLAFASPIEPLASIFLPVHMAQHMLLMMAAPPLLWLGDPLLPLIRGLPVPIRTYWIAPVFRWPALRQVCRKLTHPFVAGLIYVTAASVWHLPVLYDLALRSEGWHFAQHATFLAAGMLFWFPVVRPYPFKPRWSCWMLIPLLIAADLQNTILSALLTFSDRLLYASYDPMPHFDGSSALADQATAGAIMWLVGSLAYLLPLFIIAVRIMLGQPEIRHSVTGVSVPRSGGRIALMLVGAASSAVGQTQAAGFDLLRLPIVGGFLRWRHARICLQIPLLLLAAAVVYDGLTGPQVTPINLAGVLPWIHWRGVLMIGLLIVGNVFCMACPFMAPRFLARQLFAGRYAWPRRWRNKWLALPLLAGFFWAYDAFDLWDSPWSTAWIIIGYFAGALVVDSLFRGAAFCKYVCPIGQFNFIQSLLSPWKIKARDPAICASCQTKDCIRGGPKGRGCELGLFVPRKSSNLDCTLCLDCVHACPHGNVGLMAATPGADLWDNRRRSSIGRLARRPDIAALVIVLVYGGFANAASMVGPVTYWRSQFASLVGVGSSLWTVSIYYFVTLFALPVVVVGAAAALSRRWGRLSAGLVEVATRYTFTLAPLGFAMWLAHCSFHLFTSDGAALAAGQRFTADIGLSSSEAQRWSQACCRPVAAWLLPFEIFCLDCGLLLSLYAAYRLALSQATQPGPALRALAPWALLLLLLFAAGIWIFFQPMQMRGAF